MSMMKRLCEENHLATMTPPWTLLGELAALPSNPQPAVGPLSLWLRPFGSHPSPKIGGLAFLNITGWIRLRGLLRYSLRNFQQVCVLQAGCVLCRTQYAQLSTRVVTMPTRSRFFWGSTAKTTVSTWKKSPRKSTVNVVDCVKQLDYYSRSRRPL